MRKILSMFLTIILLMTAVTGTVFAGQGNQETFKDIKGHWGMASIMRMQSLGILNGYDDGTFRPNNPLTAEELAVILDRIVDKRVGLKTDADIESEDDEDEDEELSDVPAWARKSVAKGFTFKYLELKRFHSQVQVSRLGVAAALAKALGLDPIDDFDANPFKDLDVSSEEYGYILALFEAGILKGYPDGNFNPNGIINRSQMASIISGIFDGEDDEEEDQDLEDPQWTSGAALTLTTISTTSVELSWPDATDNVEVVAYKVYQNNVLIETLDSDENECLITDLTAGQEYTFKVRAVDDEDNFSSSLKKDYLITI